MAPVYATPQDVALEYRGSTSISSAESFQWQSWIDRVDRSIVRRFRRAGFDLAQQVSLDNPSAGDVRDAIVAAVIRKIDNPKGESSKTRTVTADDGTVSNTSRYESTKTGDDPLALTDAEWDDLLPNATPDAFSTRPGFTPDCTRLGVWP